MGHGEFARSLLSDERRKWQDPVKISRAMGVERGTTVADLGCGPGFFTLPLASLVGEGGLVYAVDADQTMLGHLRAIIAKPGPQGKRVKVVHADIASTGIPSGTVDIALFANVLHDVQDKGRFLAEVKRICTPGATVVDIDWKKVRMEIGPPFGIRLTVAESKKILNAAGLRVAESMDAGPYHYGLVGKWATPGSA